MSFRSDDDGKTYIYDTIRWLLMMLIAVSSCGSLGYTQKTSGSQRTGRLLQMLAPLINVVLTIQQSQGLIYIRTEK